MNSSSTTDIVGLDDKIKIAIEDNLILYGDTLIDMIDISKSVVAIKSLINSEVKRIVEKWTEKDWNNIKNKEGLSDWNIKITTSGGLCLHSTKTILVLENDTALFLHELAHALTEGEGHSSIWGDKFTELVRKYL